MGVSGEGIIADLVRKLYVDGNSDTKLVQSDINLIKYADNILYIYRK